MFKYKKQLHSKWNCVIAESTTLGKRALISARQQCPEASGLLPESRGVVLWGLKGRKQDQIDGSRGETPSPGGEKQPLPRPDWEKCSRQMCRNWPTNTPTASPPHISHTHECILQSCSETWMKNACAGHPSIIKRAGDKGGEMEMGGGGDGGRRTRAQRSWITKKQAESYLILRAASGSQKTSHSTVNWGTAKWTMNCISLTSKCLFFFFTEGDVEEGGRNPQGWLRVDKRFWHKKLRLQGWGLDDVCFMNEEEIIFIFTDKSDYWA